MKKALFLLLLFTVTSLKQVQAEEVFPFLGEVNSDDINIRTDSTTGSGIICAAKKSDILEVLSQRYDWYRIRLPKYAPSFVSKDLVTLTEGNNPQEDKKRYGSISKEKVNIRLAAGTDSAVIGKADKNELITIVAEEANWYKILPINNSYGWVHKKFIDKRPPVISEPPRAVEKPKPPTQPYSITINGEIRPYGKIFGRKGSHKLITGDNNVYLLKGNKKSLDTLNHRRVKVTGNLISGANEKPGIIAIEKVELLD